MKALVTGGAELIASHVVDGYLDRGLDVVIVDDLSRGSMNNVNPKARFYKAGICDHDAMLCIFEKKRPDYRSAPGSPARTPLKFDTFEDWKKSEALAAEEKTLGAVRVASPLIP